MKECKKFRRILVAFLYDELEEDKRSFLENHLNKCPICRRELEEFKNTLIGADSLKEEIEEVMSSVDWETLPSKISEHALKRKVSAYNHLRPKNFLRLFLQPKWKPVYASLLIGVLLGSLVTLLVIRSPQLKVTERNDLLVTGDFLEKLELEMARRDTLDYLEKSEYLILDFVQTSPEKSSEFWQSDFASQKARYLIMKKKYINPQLDKYQMAKAKHLCDQIEILFMELTQISHSLSKQELREVQNLIDERQLLLKINLLKKELEESEV